MPAWVFPASPGIKNRLCLYSKVSFSKVEGFTHCCLENNPHKDVLKQSWKHLKLGLVWFHVDSFNPVVSSNCFNA